MVAQLIGEYLCGFTHLLRGELARASEHFDVVIREYRREYRDSPLYVTGHDPNEACHAYQAWNAWLRGEPEQARSLSRRAVEIAYASDHPPAVAHALMFAAFVHQLLDEPATVSEHVERNRTHCEKHDIKQWDGLLALFEAWCKARAAPGKSVAGVAAQMKQGIAQWAENGGTAIVPYATTMLIETLLEGGRVTEASDAADRAIRMAEQIGERMSLPELLRLRGEALLHRDEKAARQSFEQALQVAREIGAGGWEERVARSLARLDGLGEERRLS